MKTIIATIKPKYLRDIRLGKKIFEIRKTRPKELPVKVLCCESGSGGQIKAEFVVESVEHGYPWDFFDEVEAACVSMKEAIEYAKDKEIYFWRIKYMVDYCSTKGYRIRNIKEFGLKRAPQSWQYVEGCNV